jgi:hypothetical protein
LIHSVVCAPANEADVAHAHELLHGQETQVHGDGGYTGLDKREEITRAQANGRLRKDTDWRIAMKRGQLKAMPDGPAKALYEWFERRKAQVRVIVEHPFHVIKNLFGYRKVSYRGIAKNQARAKAQAALVNLYIARRRLTDQRVNVSAGERGPGTRPRTPESGPAGATSAVAGVIKALLGSNDRYADASFSDSPAILVAKLLFYMAPDLGAWAAEIRRAQELDRLPARRSCFVGSSVSCGHGGAQRALRAPAGHAVRVGFAHLCALTLP